MPADGGFNMHGNTILGVEQSLFIGLTVFIGLHLWHWHFIVVTIVSMDVMVEGQS